MRSSLLLGSTLALSAAAGPLNFFTRRAGAPLALPISLSCLDNAFLDTDDTPNEFAGLKPSSDFVNAYQIYAYYVAMDVTSDGLRAEQLLLCEEQCNGFGEGACQSVYFAHNAPLPVGQLGVPGTPSVACVMFNHEISKDDLVDTTAGQYTRAAAVNLVC